MTEGSSKLLCVFHKWLSSVNNPLQFVNRKLLNKERYQIMRNQITESMKKDGTVIINDYNKIPNDDHEKINGVITSNNQSLIGWYESILITPTHLQW